MSVHGEFRRVLGSVIEFVAESEVRGGEACTEALQHALDEAAVDLSASAKRVLACWAEGGVARELAFPRADQRERFAEDADHLMAICNAVLGRGSP